MHLDTACSLWVWVTQICLSNMSKLWQHLFKQRLVVYLASWFCVNQWWSIINQILNENTTIFFHEYKCENVICKMGPILFQLQCVNNSIASDIYPISVRGIGLTGDDITQWLCLPDGDTEWCLVGPLWTVLIPLHLDVNGGRGGLLGVDVVIGQYTDLGKKLTLNVTSHTRCGVSYRPANRPLVPTNIIFQADYWSRVYRKQALNTHWINHDHYEFSSIYMISMA